MDDICVDVPIFADSFLVAMILIAVVATEPIAVIYLVTVNETLISTISIVASLGAISTLSSISSLSPIASLGAISRSAWIIVLVALAYDGAKVVESAISCVAGSRVGEPVCDQTLTYLFYLVHIKVARCHLAVASG